MMSGIVRWPVPLRARVVVMLQWIALAHIGQVQFMRADVIEIHELEQQPSRWQRQSIDVAGRFRSANGDRLRLVDSSLEIRLAPRVHLPRPAPVCVELAGRLEPVGTAWVLLVTRVVRRDGELAQAMARRQRIAEADVAGMFALAQWAQLRAGWYHDRPLAAFGVQSAYQGLRAIEASIDRRPGAGAAYLGLATLAAWSGVAPAEVERLCHRGLWVLARSAEQQPLARWQLLERRASSWLPAIPPGGVANLARRDDYLADPEGVFGSADTAGRVWGRHWMHQHLARRRIALAAEVPDADCVALAAEAEVLLPENPEVAAALRLRSLRREADDFQRLPRSRWTALREELSELASPEEAARYVSQWLSSTRDRLSPVDALGRARLAADYEILANDQRTAAELYLEAWRLQPALPETEAGLRRLGYQRVNESWVLPTAFAQTAGEPVASSSILPGTTEREVLRRLQQPDRVTRTVSGRFVYEQWIYDGPPALRLVLRRSPGSHEATVLAVAAP